MDRRGLTHEEATNDLPAYVMGVLDDDEVEALSAHLATCEVCLAEQAHLEETFSLVGAAADSLTPPPGLRSRVMSGLDEPDVEPLQATNPKMPTSMTARLSTWGLAAAAVLLVGVAIWAGLLHNDLQSTKQNLNHATQQQTTNTEVLANVTRTISMVADSSPDSYGTLYIGAQTNQAVLVVDELPPTPANQTYQVWLVSGQNRVSAGVFNVDQSGGAMVEITAPEPLTDYQSLGITSEPAPNGSAEPTGTRIIGCSLH